MLSEKPVLVVAVVVVVGQYYRSGWLLGELIMTHITSTPSTKYKFKYVYTCLRGSLLHNIWMVIGEEPSKVKK